MKSPGGRIVMAQVGAPHGVRGAVRLTVFAEDPLTLKRYNPFETEEGRIVRVKVLKETGKGIVAEIEGVNDRDAAAAMRGSTLSVPRARLPRPDEDEFYHVDLVGLEARLASGGILGHVRGVADFGAGDVLEVHGDKVVVVPFTREVVPQVDVAGGFVVIDPPPGLLDEPDEGEPPDEDEDGDAA